MSKIICPFCNMVYENLDESYEGANVECMNCNGKFVAHLIDDNVSVLTAAPQNTPGEDNTGMQDGNSAVNHPSVIITCPHCWRRIDFREINYISRHLDLLGDPVLGEDAQRRFLPEKFSSRGLAIDAYGYECPEMACPYCHLKIPGALFELPTSFFSIVGMPSCGKSYFLTVMLWQIRKALAKYFEFTLNDTDAIFNSVINRYESILFLNNKPQDLVALPKTELQGAGYSNQILLDGISVDLPRPFVFSLTPRQSHPQYETNLKELERNIILYDNAGEHFEPGRETPNNLATQHLTYSDGIMFLYDPLRDVRMQSICSQADPQFQQESKNQLSLFYEMTERIRKFAGLPASEKYEKPLIVVIAKFDAIKDSVDFSIDNDDFLLYDEESFEYAFNLGAVTNISFQMRKKLLEIAPELVGAAEAFSKYVYFVPVSAFGCAPSYIDQPGQNNQRVLGIRPVDIKPIWIEVPFLLQLHLHGLLEGKVVEPEGIEDITQYKFIKDVVLFSIPGERVRYELPQNYWGRYIYSQENKKYYRIPCKEGTVVQQSVKTSSALQFDKDFWEN